jgi:hypothetical protein
MPEVDELKMTARVGEILNRWPAVGPAVGVVRNGSPEFFHGHGLADIASNTPATEKHRLSDRLHHQDLHRDRRDAVVGARVGVDLDAPANDYLCASHGRNPQVVVPSRVSCTSPGSPSARASRSESRCPSLVRYYRGALRLVAEPGARFTTALHLEFALMSLHKTADHPRLWTSPGLLAVTAATAIAGLRRRTTRRQHHAA